MTPKAEARILQALQINSEDRILEIGTGCGYLTALMARLGQHVTSLEIFDDLSQSATNKLEQHSIENVEIINQDVFKAMPSESSYDVIVLTASLPTQNDQFTRALTAHGRLFSIIGQSPVMEALLIKGLSTDSSQSETWHSESLFENRYCGPHRFGKHTKIYTIICSICKIFPPIELKQFIHTKPQLLLLDVREEWEYETCCIEGSKNISMSQIAASFDNLDKGSDIVVICHHGMRSQQAGAFLEHQGFENILNLVGGIHAWANDVEPDMAKY